jgi:hypothetical protein
MSLPAHLFVSDCDGHLYDTREPNWSSRPPLRRHYQTHPRHLRLLLSNRHINTFYSSIFLIPFNSSLREARKS